MLDFSHIPTAYPHATVEYFQFPRTSVNPSALGNWLKPRGKSMAHIILVGAGGNGGNGAIGANSAAAGGGGGASGTQTSITVPLWAIPDVLYFVGGSGSISIGLSSAPVLQDTLISASYGNNGGNASGATAGAAGAVPTTPSVASNMVLAGPWIENIIGAQTGIIGGVAVAGAALTLPTSGLLVTGGTGGGGLPAADAAGTNGGAFTVAGIFPAHAGGAGAAAAGTVPGSGGNGYSPIAKLLYGYGGTGGGSTHGTATGAGLQQSSGGNGAPGCGGGGSGGALTGSAAGVAGLGGPSFCIITTW